MHDEATARRGGCGCWLIGGGAMLLVAVLVIAGLFLPPFDLYNRLIGEPYATLHLQGDSLTSADKVVRVTAAGEETNGVSIRLKTWTQTPGAPDWVTTALGRLPRMLVARSSLYGIDVPIQPQNALILSIELPRSGIAPDVVDLYGWYGDALNGKWRFIPSETIGSRRETVTRDLPQAVMLVQTTPVEPLVLASYETTQMMLPEVSQVARIVSPAGLTPLADGQIAGGLAPGVEVNAGYQVMPVVRDYLDPRAVDTTTVNAILSNAQLRRQHAAILSATASVNQYSGLFIDYRGVAPEQRENFSLFIEETSAEMKKVGLLLGVVVPMPDNQEGVWNTGAYDWRAIGQAADYVQINVGIAPRSFQRGAGQPVEAMLTWAKGEISRYKILVGLSAQSVREIADTVTRIGYDEGLAGLGNVRVDAPTSATNTIAPGAEIRAHLDGQKTRSGIDSELNAPYIEYLSSDDSVAARVWLTTPDALRYRLDSTVPLLLGGVAFDDLMSDDLSDGLINEIQNYRLSLPAAPAPVDLVLRWRIEGTNGLIGEVRTDLNAPLVITLAAPDGEYSIKVAVEGTGQEIESDRPGVTVAQYRPTATPTPPPTETPTPAPTNTPTLQPIQATQAAASGGPSSPAVRPSGGSIVVGNFEYGGHVTDAGSGRAIGAMQRAGMTWMKIQKRFYSGGTDNAAGQIAAAKANGFKILVGTVGNPDELAAGGESYMQQYASWLGQVAAAGADAIEVWNEPNLAREWPEGQISGASYARMLQMGYQAIKAANPGTMVISAAPAPTGAEAAFPGRVRNDNGWLQEVVDAGGLQYMDCLGAHYNEGILPPNATSGDPRDPYYTRYFTLMLNTYSGIVGGQKPICFTELGYLTPEGYGQLPEFFSWAQNVTVSQQAAWLAQAAALASQSGKVRMMIVWNVDFTLFGSDPQGGYAIVRPDGSCPACEALAGAR